MERITLGHLNPKRFVDTDHFYVKKENGLHWLCHQHAGSVEKALFHCVPISEQFYLSFLLEAKTRSKS